MATAVAEKDPRQAARAAAAAAGAAAKMAGLPDKEAREKASEAARRVWKQITELPVEDPLAAGDVSRAAVEELRERRARKSRLMRGMMLAGMR